MRFKFRIPILLIVSLLIISIIGVPKNTNAEPDIKNSKEFSFLNSSWGTHSCCALSGYGGDSLKSGKSYILSEEQMKTARLIQEENIFLRNEVKSFRRSDSLQNSVIKKQNSEIVNCGNQVKLKDDQIRILESKPLTTTVVDSRKWFEIPAAFSVGAVVGVLLKILFFK